MGAVGGVGGDEGVGDRDRAAVKTGLLGPGGDGEEKGIPCLSFPVS